MFSLEEGKIGETYVFEQIMGTSFNTKHLLDLGFIPGAKIRIISTNNKNDYILSVKNARIAVNKDIVHQIFVSELDESKEEAYQTLDEMEVGSSSCVERVLGKGAIRRRLMDMGLTKGVRVTIKKMAPLGDPIEITIRGYELTLRKNEAELIMVKE